MASFPPSHSDQLFCPSGVSLVCYADQNIVRGERRDLKRPVMGSLSPVSILPDELVMSVLSWLPVSDLCNALLVCRHWRTLGRTGRVGALTD